MRVEKHSHHIHSIPGFLPPEQCSKLIAAAEQMGFHNASLYSENGDPVPDASPMNSRVMYYRPELAKVLWDRLWPFAKTNIGPSYANGLSELFRIYRFEPGHEFETHRDKTYIRNPLETSYFSFSVFLNDDFEGGQLSFADGNVSIKPETGTAVIFLHDLKHEASPVTKGVKYVLRSEIIYELVFS